MNVRELIYKIKDRSRQGHYIILYYSDLDKEVQDVIRENQNHPEYTARLENLIQEFGINEETMSNTIDFMGSGKDIVELMKKALCDFKEIHIDEAILTSPDKSIDEGTTVISLIINIPKEKKWVSMYYTHMEDGVGYGSISYNEHNYQDQPFPQNWVEKSTGKMFPWGNSVLTEQQILDKILERNKCHK